MANSSFRGVCTLTRKFPPELENPIKPPLPESWKIPRPAPESILSFYLDDKPNAWGQTLSSLLSMDYNEFHTSCIWMDLCPIPEEVVDMRKVALVDFDVYQAFREASGTGVVLRGKLRHSLVKIGWYLGFEVEIKSGEAGVIIATSSNPIYQERRKTWNISLHYNHNRITLLIHSLRVLGLSSEALALYEATMEDQVVPGLGSQIMEEAMFNPLRVHPNPTGANYAVPQWLKDVSPDGPRVIHKLVSS